MSLLRLFLLLNNWRETSKCPTGATILPSRNVTFLSITPLGPCLSTFHTDNRLKEQFSRLQYTRNSYSSPPTHAITRLAMPLKYAARDAYYTDIIGNVSTSRYRPGRGTTDSHLEIQPRYPVYGGWNYTFRLGWNVDLEKVERISGTERILRVPFLEGAENVQYKKFNINIILPEGAR